MTSADTVAKLHKLDESLVRMRRSYDAAALEDRFGQADEIDAAHRLVDDQRQAVWMRLNDAETQRYEVERQERYRHRPEPIC